MKRNDDKPPRFVELIRVSTENQEDHETPERQRAGIDKLRVSRPGLFVERLEIVVSGTLPLAATREGRRLAELAASKAFDELRVHSFDRLFGQRSLDPRIQAEVPGLCFEAGAVIVESDGCVTDASTMTGKLLQSFKGATAAVNRIELLKRTNEGRFNAAKAGRSPGGMPFFGRRFDRITKQWMYVPEERQLFDEIRAWIRDDCTAQEICRRLNARGTPTITGRGRWYARTLVRFLRSRHLVGESLVTNKHVPDETAVLRLPPLLTEAEFDDLQRALDSRRPKGRPRTSKNAPLCAGRIFCACGARMYCRNALYYRCSTSHSDARSVRGQAKCAQYRSHRTEHVDAAVWEAVLAYVSGDVLADAAHDRPDVSGYREEAARCDQLLADLVGKEKDITAAYRRRRLSQEAWLAELDSVMNDRKTLERTRRVAAETVARFEAASASRESIRSAVAGLRDRIRTASLEDRRLLLQALIPDQIGLGIVIGRDGQITINAGIVDAGADAVGAQGAGSAGDKVCRPS